MVNTAVESNRIPTVEQDATDIVALDKIHKIENHNPRRIRSQQERDDMRESIRKTGVLQPILVRPHPTLEGEFELVAGETRVDLSREVGLTAIPALIKSISDAQLTEFATIENLQRAVMSPLDEGLAAQRMIKAGYSKNEVCLVMGWSVQKLDGRIQLTHCIEPVGQALMDKQISIGHAQILSGLRDSSQAMALKVILSKGYSVEEFRHEIERLSLKLSIAPFDTTECASCQHNSSTQANLFDAQASEGNCLNKACYEKKSGEHLEQVQADLKESYNTVELSEKVAPGTTQIIVSTGKMGVGQEQMSACQTCEHYGAIIDSALGNRAKVTQGVCFNLACHDEKVAAYQHVIGADIDPGRQATHDSDAAKAASSNATTQAKAATSKPASPAKVEPAKPKRSAIPSKIVEQHHKVHRSAAANHLSSQKDRRAAQIVAIIALLNDCQQKPEGLPEGMPKSFTGVDRAKAAVRLDTLDDTALDDLMIALSAQALKEATRGYSSNGSDCYGALAEWYSATRSADLTKHFTVDTDYLNAFTKPVIGELLTESGFAKAYNVQQDNEKAFETLVKGKKTDILKAVEASKFDFQGFIPKALKI